MADTALVVGLARAVVFDFDDTLIATSASRKPLFWKFVRMFSEFSDETLEAVWGRPMHDMLGRLLPQIETERALDVYRELIELSAPAPLLPGVDECIRCMSREDKTLLILTSSAKRLVESDLSRHNLLAFFDMIYSSDDVPFAKPDHRIMVSPLRWLESRGIPPTDGLYIGDSVSDFELARSAGMPFIGVTTGATSHEVFLRAGCTDTIASLAELASATCGSGEINR